jgi:hypothetical protein
MKPIALFILGLSIMLFFHGCNNGPLTSGGSGFYPKIEQIQILNINDPSNPILWGSYKTGDNISFNMEAEDNDLNMKTLWVTVYPTDSDTIYSGPEAIALSKQDKEAMLYYQIGSINLTEPAGKYDFIFEVEDETGNRSKTYFMSIIVE